MADIDTGEAGRPTRALPQAIAIFGPTASGKSALAAALASSLGGEVINADALQIYRELPIISAQPSAAERTQAPHRLYGVLPATERCSAGRWRELALAAMGEAVAAGRVPILVGGTGLYLEALIDGLAEMPAVPPEVRAAAAERWAFLGPAAFHAEVAERDPLLAARVPASDRQRLLRAWEVATATGRALSDWQVGAQRPAPFRFQWIVLLPRTTDLQPAMERRFDAMLAEGAVAEVQGLLDQGLDERLPAMKAVGVPELAGHLAGRWDLATARAAAVQATRRYAKRQGTWARGRILVRREKMMRIDRQFSQCCWPEIFAEIKACRLTGCR